MDLTKLKKELSYTCSEYLDDVYNKSNSSTNLYFKCNIKERPYIDVLINLKDPYDVKVTSSIDYTYKIRGIYTDPKFKNELIKYEKKLHYISN